MTIEALAKRFVADEVRPTSEGENPMPWKVLRSCLVRYAKYHEVDKGEPGRINKALRAALADAGYERVSAEGGGKYPTKLYVGSWPEFVADIDGLMAQEGRTA